MPQVAIEESTSGFLVLGKNSTFWLALELKVWEAGIVGTQQSELTGLEVALVAFITYVLKYPIQQQRDRQTCKEVSAVNPGEKNGSEQIVWVGVVLVLRKAPTAVGAYGRPSSA